MFNRAPGASDHRRRGLADQRIRADVRLPVDQHADLDMAADGIGLPGHLVGPQGELADARRQVADADERGRGPMILEAHARVLSSHPAS
jgi:hypothetical protein